MAKKTHQRPRRTKPVRKSARKEEKNAVKITDVQNELKPTRKGEIIALLACVPFFLLGVALIIIGIKEISSTVPCTAEISGKIISVSTTHTLKNGEQTRKSRNKVTYSYVLDDKELTDYFVTAKSVAAYKNIKIRYNPDNPEQKYVKGYDDAGNVLILIWGIIWDGFFILIGWFIITLCRNERSAANKNKL